MNKMNWCFFFTILKGKKKMFLWKREKSLSRRMLKKLSNIHLRCFLMNIMPLAFCRFFLSVSSTKRMKKEKLGRAEREYDKINM